MSPVKFVCAVLVLLVTASCTSRDTKASYAAPSPECRQARDKDHPLEKVGRTIFWLEIKLMEQAKKTSADGTQSQECSLRPA